MNENYGAEYASLYAEHWWWRSRESMIVDVIRRLNVPVPTTVLDVGCGDAVAFPALSQFGTVVGIEIDRSLVSEGNPHAKMIHHEPLGDPVYRGRQFGLITALDVIEHIKDDRQAVADMVDMLIPGGILVVTVPAFMSLWDKHDVINHHFRRYTSRQVLDARGCPAGWLFFSRALFSQAMCQDDQYVPARFRGSACRASGLRESIHAAFVCPGVPVVP